MYRFLLFDADDTVFDFLRAERTALRLAMEDCGIVFKDEYVEIYSAHNKKMWESLERKEITKPWLIANRFRTFFEKMGFREDAEAMKNAYQVRLGEQSFLLPGAKELLESLSPDRRIFLITNGLKATQSGRLSRSGILPLLSGVFISEEVGFEKPDARYFEEVERRIPGFTKEEAIVIGDSLTSDILGGNNAGIKTIWFNPKHKPNNTEAVPTFEADSFERIREIVTGQG